jgi:hypothetical protein
MSAAPPPQEHSSRESEGSGAAVGTEAAKDARRVRRTASHLSKRRPLLIDLFHPAPKHENPGLPGNSSSNGCQPGTDGGSLVHQAPSERSLYMGSATGAVATNSAATSTGGPGHRHRKGGGPSANVFGDALLDRPSTAVGLPADAAKTVRSSTAREGSWQRGLVNGNMKATSWWGGPTHVARVEGSCMRSTANCMGCVLVDWCMTPADTG